MIAAISLQATFKKTAGRLSFVSNYTFGKVLGVRDGNTSNGGGNGAIANPYDLDSNYGVLAYDHSHVFNVAYTYELPDIIKGNAFGRAAINGWKLSGITQWQSGAPIQPNTNENLNAVYPSGVNLRNLLGTDQGILLPQVTCDPRKGLKDGQYFNPACFTYPTKQGAYGDIVWPYIKGPSYFNSDLSVYKSFKITEGKSAEFRFSAFNFINHSLKQFNADGTNNDLRLNFIGAGDAASTSNTNQFTTGEPLWKVGRRVVELALKFYF